VQSYERFFGLREAPFSLAPNPKFLFESAAHKAALDQVAYALRRREPLVVITGEVGTGKTLLCRTVMQRIERKTFMSVINDPLLARDDLLRQLLEDFGVISKDRSTPAQPSRHDLIRTLQGFLASLVPLHAHAVVMIDEAQHLQPDVLEQIRLLSNIDDERGTMLQIILVGQTDLEPLLSRPEMRQLQQRVTRRFRLEPLNEGEVRQYIEHRLEVARGRTSSQVPGAKELERAMADWWEAGAEASFTPEAIQAVATISAGLPRVINIVCDRALEAAYFKGQHTIDASIIRAAASALGLPAPEGRAPEEPLHEPAPALPAEKVASAPPAEEAPPDSLDLEWAAAAGPASKAKVLWLAALVVLAVAAGFWGIRGLNRPAAPAPAEAPQAPAAATPAPSAAPPEPAPAPPAPVAGTPTPTSPTSDAAAAAPSALQPGVAATSPSGERFEIIVASFRTSERATFVASEVASLGLPTRRRTASGWQQVLSGPFATRAEAENAQNQLDRAGFTGTQVVSTIP
jgi:general secretion pathway protein A